MDQHLIEMIIAIVCAAIASSGFWAFIQSRMNRHDSGEKLLLGLAHDRIMYLGTSYMNRGYITPDEYENLVVYLYEPYMECGGNGSAKHIMEHVMRLEIRNDGKRGDY